MNVARVLTRIYYVLCALWNAFVLVMVFVDYKIMHLGMPPWVYLLWLILPWGLPTVIRWIVRWFSK